VCSRSRSRRKLLGAACLSSYAIEQMQRRSRLDKHSVRPSNLISLNAYLDGHVHPGEKGVQHKLRRHAGLCTMIFICI
jgi:hypothetical protein